jgi:hypothetical protein
LEAGYEYDRRILESRRSGCKLPVVPKPKKPPWREKLSLREMQDGGDRNMFSGLADFEWRTGMTDSPAREFQAGAGGSARYLERFFIKI